MFKAAVLFKKQQPFIAIENYAQFQMLIKVIYLMDHKKLIIIPKRTSIHIPVDLCSSANEKSKLLIKVKLCAML